jgi:hypothetical protein
MWELRHPNGRGIEGASTANEFYMGESTRMVMEGMAKWPRPHCSTKVGRVAGGERGTMLV